MYFSYLEFLYSSMVQCIYVLGNSVLIIGAGLAGISAAKTLSYAGVKNIAIVEGSDRVGGRIKSVQFGGRTIEVGASYIQGLTDNPIWYEAQEALLTGRVANDDSYIVLSSNGEDLTTEADEYYESFSEFTDEVASRRVGKDERPDGVDQSVRAVLTSLGWRPNTEVMDLLEVEHFDWESGAAPEILSVNYGKPDHFQREDPREYFVTDQRGFQIVPQMMLEKLLDDTNVLHLNKVVDKVVFRDGFASISTTDNSTFTADYVISTIPLGVLKHRMIDFNPRLPKWKQDAIDGHYVGALTGIFLKYNSSVVPFWTDVETIMHASTLRGRYSIITNLDLQGEFPANMLLVTATGAEAYRISRLTDEQINEEVTEVLRGMYGDAVPLADDIYVSDWITDPLSMGAQSAWPVGMSMDQFRDLNDPVESLYFAGEAHSMSYGTVQGAMDSGHRTATQLIQCMTFTRKCIRHSKENL